MKAKILGLLAVALLAGPLAAHATIVSAGETVLWSFDLTATTPPPPFMLNSDGLEANYSELSQGFAGYWTLYSDANGTEQVIQFDELFGAMYGFNWILDGIGSARLTMTAGSATLSPCASGVGALAGGGFGITACVAGVLVDAVPVPEPGTLALLGLSLAGLGASRQRRVN